jgi:hypothetical protein
MTDDEIELLRARAQRAKYPSMARLARALYARGLGPRDVIRGCYGVDFPAEFFATTREWLARPGLLVHFTDLPWELTRPPGEGGVSSSPSKFMASAERRILARDPDLVPLMQLIGHLTKLQCTVICYRLTELRAGGTTVFGITEKPRPHDPIVHCGDSLLAVLHAHHVDYLQQMEWILDQPWNFGFGALDQRAVDQSRLLVGKVEALQREVSSRDSG